MEIEFCETVGGKSDAKDFLKAQPRSAQKKFFHLFEQIESRGMLAALQSEIVKKIKPEKRLYELRYGGNKLTYRYFFTPFKNCYWILCGFAKKSQKTPKRELETARRRYKNLIHK